MRGRWFVRFICFTCSRTADTLPVGFRIFRQIARHSLAHGPLKCCAGVRLAGVVTDGYHGVCACAIPPRDKRRGSTFSTSICFWISAHALKLRVALAFPRSAFSPEMSVWAFFICSMRSVNMAHSSNLLAISSSANCASRAAISASIRSSDGDRIFLPAFRSSWSMFNAGESIMDCGVGVCTVRLLVRNERK